MTRSHSPATPGAPPQTALAMYPAAAAITVKAESQTIGFRREAV